MSAKVVFDRIYAALENGDYSLAQQLCQKPEIAKYSLAHALLAYSYASQRQYDKALELARVVNNLQSSDESVVNALGCTFKLCKADEDFALCYENAMKSPGCMAAEHNVLELFYCYGRLNQPKKMQQVAQKLYKTTDNSKYLLWSTGCMLLQSDLSATMLAVAEKMLRKVLCDTPDRAPGAEELPLFLLVLVRQGKLKEALEELGSLRKRRGTERLQDEHDFKRNVNGVQSPTLALDLIKIDLLRALHYREDVMAACYEVLEQYPDQWNLHQVLLDCVFGGPATFLDGVSELLPLRDLSPWTSCASVPVAIAEAQQEVPCDASVSKHLERLEGWQRRHPKLRGPFLAELHALRRWATRGAANAALSAESASLLPRLASRLENYVQRFQGKPCCFADLQPLLAPLAESSCGAADEALWASLQQHTAQLRDTLANELRATLAERTARPQTGEDVAGPAEGLGEGIGEGEGEGGDEGGDDGRKKAGRKGRKPKKAKKKAGGAAEPVMKPVDAPRLQALATRDSDVVVQLTAYAQLDLVASRCAERLSPPAAEQPLGDFLDQRLPLFAASTALFANGVGGELRCQQPGDDVMLVVSQRLQRSAAAVDWSAALLFALEKSKFNFNLKIDLLEACWRLGHAALALDMWHGLGVKNIQHDSMSYLIVPLLLERGYFAEARSQCQAVIACQRSTRRETADMLAHAFDFANYHKALELGAFLDVSQRSLALAAARQEFLLLEFADRGFRASAVKAMDTAWFHSYAPHEVAGLASHCDYALLARAGDARDVAAVPPAAARQRDDQLRVRVHWAQAIAQLVHHHVHALWELVAQDLQRLPPLDELLSAAAAVEASETARFSQAALTCDAQLVACTHAVWRAAGRALLLASCRLALGSAGEALDALDAALTALGDMQRQLTACPPARVVVSAAACLLYLLGPGGVLLQDALARSVEAKGAAGAAAAGAAAGVDALRGMALAAAGPPSLEEVQAQVEAVRGDAAAPCLCAWGLACAWRALLHTVRGRLEQARPRTVGSGGGEDGDTAMRCLRAVQGDAGRLRERVEAGLRQSHEESCARLLKCAGDIDFALRAAGKSHSK